MCGIFGVLGREVQAANIDNALHSLRKRGPDGATAKHLENTAGVFGHVRLSVIDLSDFASQPMYSACERYLIVFNGEIYNFSEIRTQIGTEYGWRSHSDTEVVLAAYIKWGVKCLDHFHGMFALAIWDKQEKRLFAARDRLGVKPFYYHADNGMFAFASRPRTLFNLIPDLPREIDRQALRYYVEAGYVPAPHSIYHSIEKLEPGQFILFDHQGLRKFRYWSLDNVQVDASFSSRSENSLLDELDELIRRSVRWRMVSDVPVGAFLSGGIDSSLVAALMVRHASGPVKTFTIGFGDREFDESHHAQAVADHLGSDHYVEQLAPNDLLELMPDYIEEFDEPFFDYSAFPVMAVSRMARRHVKVSLSGDGGDEVFGGYHYYRVMQGLRPAFELPVALRKMGASLLAGLPAHRMRLLGHALSQPNLVEAFAFMRSVAKNSEDVLTPEARANTQSLRGLFSAYAQCLPRGLSPAEQGMRIDAHFTLPDDYLQKVDVGSMAFSLEARDPLLDHSIFEWGAKLPLSWKLRGKTNKYLLRQLAYRYVPRDILDRPKMGFGVPMAKWLRTDLREWAENLLRDREAFEALGLNKSIVLELWQSHLSGKRQAHTCLWTILVLLQFYQNNFQAVQT